MPRISAKGLLDIVRSSFESAGWDMAVYDSSKPFGIRIHRSGRGVFNLRVFIWNCTHGGGAARPTDEYRIQFTGVVPNQLDGATTLLLGWSEKFRVFAAWNIRKHDGQNSISPSAQIREDVLRRAYLKGFAIGVRGNEEIVAAFRPELIAEYAANAADIHEGVIDELAVLNDMQGLDVYEDCRNYGRKKVVSQIVRAYREYDFSRRVVTAYGGACSVCGIQLRLVEAAHIVPVTEEASNDNTENGVALCVLHHRAYDKNIISINERYEVEVSDAELTRLGEDNLLGGLDEFRRGLRRFISLPADARDYPSPDNLALSRTVRGWRA